MLSCFCFLFFFVFFFHRCLHITITDWYTCVCIYISLYVTAALTLGCGNCCDSDIVITMNQVSSDTRLCLELIGPH